MAGVLAGVSSIHCCGFDEAIGLPSELAHKTAVRTQQILAYETGVAVVADPLGGSYYVEALTERIADDASSILDTITSAAGSSTASATAGSRSSSRPPHSSRSGRSRPASSASWDPTVPSRRPRRRHRVGSRSSRWRSTTDASARSRSSSATATRPGRRTHFEHCRRRPRQAAREPRPPRPDRVCARTRHLGEVVGTIRQAFGLHYDAAGILEPAFQVAGLTWSRHVGSRS